MYRNPSVSETKNNVIICCTIMKDSHSWNTNSTENLKNHCQSTLNLPWLTFVFWGQQKQVANTVLTTLANMLANSYLCTHLAVRKPHEPLLEMCLCWQRNTVQYNQIICTLKNVLRCHNLCSFKMFFVT